MRNVNSTNTTSCRDGND